MAGVAGVLNRLASEFPGKDEASHLLRQWIIQGRHSSVATLCGVLRHILPGWIKAFARNCPSGLQRHLQLSPDFKVPEAPSSAPHSKRPPVSGEQPMFPGQINLLLAMPTKILVRVQDVNGPRGRDRKPDGSDHYTTTLP